MSDLSIIRNESQALTPLPQPSVDISVRKATMDDLPFIDALQKSEPGKLGFQFESALIKRIKQGNILIAEATEGLGCRAQGVGKDTQTTDDSEPTPYNLSPTPSPAIKPGIET